MLNILVDTCVWIDLAKDPDQRPLLGALEELVKMKEVRLIVPQTIIDELARNRARIVQESGRSMAGVFRRVREVVEKHDNPESMQQVLNELSDVNHKIPTLGESVSASLVQIDKLLSSGPVIEISDDVKLRAAQRAIDRLAPFHRQRNGIDDAILIEVYERELRGPASKGHRYAFVTHNTKDFSDPNGDDRTPHPDLSPLFTRIKSRYYTKLSNAVNAAHPDLVSDLMFDYEGWDEEPRQLSEIAAAIGELLDKVWYNRHKVFEAKVLTGKIKVVERETFPIKDHQKRPVQRDVWEGAKKAAERKEAQYGLDQLGPWSDFEWGMLNGKLSALRWVLGDEWDMLDT